MIGRARAEYLLKRGHRKILRLNATVYASGDEGEEHEGFVSALADAGVAYDPAWSVRPEDAFARIHGLLDEGGFTAAVVNGGEAKMRNVLQVLDRHQEGRRIELLVDYIGGLLPGLIAEFPRLRVVAVNHYPDHELGVAAAQALLDRLQDGTPMTSMRIGSQIRRPDGTPIS